ncbi:MAG: SprB repeat-containing protein [Lewinellaceae bacterium]|nr:SprB repeat-containing protein [Lewinellaceae bacterium]
MYCERHREFDGKYPTGGKCYRNDDCFGYLNGSALAIASGGTGPSYTWSNGQTSAMATGLTGSTTFTVTVTNSAGCTASSSVFMEPYMPQVQITGIMDACLNQNNGNITAQATDGEPPYQFQWSNGVTTSTVNNLWPGSILLPLLAAMAVRQLQRRP